MSEEKNVPLSESARLDRLNAIGVLTRREIEARILGPLIAALGEEFGREETLAVVRKVIIDIARQQGEQLAESMGGHSLAHFVDSLEAWKKDDAMQMDLLEQNEERFFFNVTRCRYAEMYQQSGIPELGEVLSCSRDAALIEGFNPQIELTREQTIMEGKGYCSFRYRVKK